MVSHRYDCVPNIGPRQRRRRMTFGVFFLLAGAALAGVLLAQDASRSSRLLAFVPFWIGAIGIVQATEKTCVALVARGQKNMDQGSEEVADLSALQQMRAQARRVHKKAFLLALFAAAAVAAVPPTA
jgi:hypothetical protein